MRRIACCVLGVMLCAPFSARAADDYQHRLEQVLLQTPLIDGHNDLPWEIRDRFKSDFAAIDLRSDTSRLAVGADQTPLMTDIPRLRAGMVGAQFWSVWIPVTHARFRSGANDAGADRPGEAHGRAVSKRLRDGIYGRGYSPHSQGA